MQPRAKEYRRGCVKALLKTWPGLDGLKMNRISKEDCNDWAKRFRDAGYDAYYFNQTLSTLRHVLDQGELNANPAQNVKRLGVKMRESKVPEPEQFLKLLENIEHGGVTSRHSADLVRFLAFSGCRLSEAKGVIWADLDLKRGSLKAFHPSNHSIDDNPWETGGDLLY
jgi:site-specific recombinase XerC